MSFLASFSILDVFPRLWDCLQGPVRYITQIQQNNRSLQDEWLELKAMRNDLQTRLDNAETPQMKQREVVAAWLSSVKAMEAGVDMLIADSTQQVENTCLADCCPRNCWSSYKLGKKVAKKLEDVKKLKIKGDFSTVVDKIPLPPMDERPSSSTVGLESTFDKVWRCLVEEEVGIIGLYGMGGVGKTTLLTKINNQFAKSTHDFKLVIWVLVSQDVNAERIQNKIGEKLGFSDDTWKSKSQDDKAIDIHRILKGNKFVLLLDDIWKRVDLVKFGVPLPQKTNGSKLVFTTRSYSVCGQMEAHKKVKVECLTKDQALELFNQKVGEDVLNSHPELPKLAEAVAEECKGLPLALVTVGRAMACKKTVEEWNHAIETLRSYASRFSGMTDEVFGPLKFSYDSLCSEQLKFCFLYCSLFPEDHAIYRSRIIGYWISEGVLGGNEGIRNLRDMGYDVISNLVHACLLEFVNEHLVRMHDVIRDMAIWISNECEEAKGKFLFQSRICDVENHDGKWSHVERLSLIRSPVKQLTVPITFHNLSTLLLKECGLREICNDFFKFMPNLRVLDISMNQDLKEIPLGIASLVLLEYLDLLGTGIARFPVEFKSLKKLNFLGLETIQCIFIPLELLSNFQMMHTLRLHSVPSDGNVALIEELESLQHLQELSITIESNSVLQKLFNSKKLCGCTEHLRLWNFRGSTLLDLISLQNLKKLRFLKINGWNDLRDFCIENREEREAGISESSYPRMSKVACFESLRSVDVVQCSGIKDLTWLIYTPNLTDLWVHHCIQIQHIIDPEKVVKYERHQNLILFSKLQTLNIQSLPELSSIYSESLAFPSLAKMSVSACPKLKRIPIHCNSSKERKIEVKGEEEWWKGLEWEDDSITNLFSFVARTL